MCTQFLPHLICVTTLPCQTQMFQIATQHIEHTTRSRSWSSRHLTSYLRHWPPNSPDLNPVDYSVWSVLQEEVYRSKIADIDELKTRLVNQWAQFDQLIIDAAISQWRRRLNACVRARGAHFEHKF